MKQKRRTLGKPILCMAYRWQFLTLIRGTTNCVLCCRYEIMLFEKGAGHKLAASDWQIIDFNNPSIIHCFIDTFSDP